MRSKHYQNPPGLGTQTEQWQSCERQHCTARPSRATLLSQEDARHFKLEKTFYQLFMPINLLINSQIHLE